MGISLLSLALAVVALPSSNAPAPQAKEPVPIVESAVEEQQAAQEAKEMGVTSVYEADAAGYGLTVKKVKMMLNPGTRKSISASGFDLPDAFYYIAAPLFFFFFMRVFIVFLDDIEEQRIQELREQYREHHGAH